MNAHALPLTPAQLWVRGHEPDVAWWQRLVGVVATRVEWHPEHWGPLVDLERLPFADEVRGRGRVSGAAGRRGGGLGPLAGRRCHAKGWAWQWARPPTARVPAPQHVCLPRDTYACGAWPDLKHEPPGPT
jgi:hypothetical protein